MTKLVRFRGGCLPSRTRVVAVVIAACVFATLLVDGAERPITLGVVMDDATRKQREPLRAYLSKAMGRPVTIAAPDTFKETVDHLADGSYDFACLGALMYIRAHEAYGVVPLVQRDFDRHYQTVFITGVNSSIYSLRDLKGKQVAFGDVDSTSAHMMAEFELKEAGIDSESDFRLRYSGSHPATAAMVETGVVDAGAIDETVLQFLISAGKVNGNKIRIFYTSKPYFDYVYVARKDLPEAERNRFTRALLALKKGKDDPILKILRAKTFVVAHDEDYAHMRQIAHKLQLF